MQFSATQLKEATISALAGKAGEAVAATELMHRGAPESRCVSPSEKRLPPYLDRGRQAEGGQDMRTIIMTLVFVLVCMANPAASQEDRTTGPAKGAAVFEVGLWPGEGRPRLVAGTTTLVLRTEARKDAPTGTVLQVKKAQLVEFGETLYRTTVPGRLKVLKDSQVTGRRLGSILRLSGDDYYSGEYPTASLSVRSGEVIDYLQDRAEGTCFVRIRGEVIDADPCPHFVVEPADQFALEAEPQTEWWVQVLLKGQPKGWLLVDGRNVREERRTF